MRFFDLHCDTPYKCFMEKRGFNDSFLAVSVVGGNIFSEWKQCFAVWIKDDIVNPFEFYKSVISDFKEKLSDAPNNLKPIFTVEGGALLENDIERLYELSNDEIKVLALTWNGKNSLASGVYAEGGLSILGREAIKVMNDLKMACDLSHLNGEGFYEAVEISQYPVLTHSCCEAVFSHPRNASDEQIKLISERNGLIGLCLYPEFLGGDDVFESVYKHLYYLLNLGADRNICIGSDFDGADMSPKLKSIENVPRLYDFLYSKGLSGGILDDIFYKNAENFFLKL